MPASSSKAAGPSHTPEPDVSALLKSTAGALRGVLMRPSAARGSGHAHAEGTAGSLLARPGVTVTGRSLLASRDRNEASATLGPQAASQRQPKPWFPAPAPCRSGGCCACCLAVGGLAFLNPWLLLGLLGASLPVVIHLIGRRRAPKVRFAAIDFLLAVNKRLARRERLRQFLLLLLRTLAIAALVFAISRPISERPAVAASESRRLALVIDASASMSYVKDGETLLSYAKTRAKRVLSHLQPGDMATLIVAGEEPRAAMQAPTLQLEQVREAIEELELDSGPADMGAAIELALSQMGEDGSNVTLAVISDLAANGFNTVQPTSMDPPPDVRLIDAAERDAQRALGNVSVASVEVRHSPQSPSVRRFEIVVRNHGDAPVSDRALELVIDGEVTHKAFVSVEGRASAEKTLTHRFESPGVYSGRVRLQGSDADGYTRDDFVPFVLQVIPGVRVLAVNGQPRTTPREDELYFVSRALANVPEGQPPIALDIVTTEELETRTKNLEGIDVVLLANVATLSDKTVERLVAFMNAGGGLMLALGETIRFEEANEQFGALLPHPLRDLHLAADPAAGTPPLAIEELEWSHPILQGLGLAVEESLRSSKTRAYFNLQVGLGRSARTILGYSNGAPALVEGRREDAGRSLLLTTSVDLDLSDLALRSAFPALLQRSVRYLAGAVDQGSNPILRRGSDAVVAAPTGAEAVALIAPSGKRRVAEVQAGDAEQQARFAKLEETGTYTVEVKRSDWERAPSLDLAVAPDLSESDFQPVPAQDVSQALGGEQGEEALATWVGARQGRDPFEARGYAPYFLLALGLLFVSESVLAARG